MLFWASERSYEEGGWRRLNPKQDQEYLRRIIQERTGRHLAEVLREYHDRRGGDLESLARIFTRLAGERVTGVTIENWLTEFEIWSPDERWAVTVAKVGRLLDQVIEAEIERRASQRSSTPG